MRKFFIILFIAALVSLPFFVKALNFGELSPGGLVKTFAYWKLNGDSTDSSGNSHTGTASSSVGFGTLYGKFGKGAVFNGTSSYITTTGLFGNATNSITMRAWIRPSSTATGLKTVFNLGPDTGVAGNAFVVGESIISAGDFGGTYLGGTSNAATVGGQFTAGRWYHVVVTGGRGTIQPNTKVYINCKAIVANQGTGSTNINLLNGTGTIGATQEGANRWVGAIDDLIIASSVWTQQQVCSDYNQSRGFYGPQNTSQ